MNLQVNSLKADHPITPPPELVQQWVTATESNDCIGAFPTNFEQRICTAAAQWGADQELEACEKYWMTHGISPQGVVAMRYARRPQPPSLKEQALETLKYPKDLWSQAEVDTIRRALEALPE
jgi:molybdopterin-guanine dinucleotide biosynthesis protein A